MHLAADVLDKLKTAGRGCVDTYRVSFYISCLWLYLRIKHHVNRTFKMRRFILLFVAIIISGTLEAQDTSFDFKLDHVALSVTDVDLAARFCVDVLRLKEITNRSKLEDVRWFSMGPDRELHLIGIIKEGVKTNKAVHVALTTSNFDAFVKNLEQRKIPYSDWPGNPQKVNIRADGIKQIFFQGFDDYWFEVNSVK